MYVYREEKKQVSNKTVTRVNQLIGATNLS